MTGGVWKQMNEEEICYTNVCIISNATKMWQNYHKLKTIQVFAQNNADSVFGMNAHIYFNRILAVRLLQKDFQLLNNFNNTALKYAQRAVRSLST